MQNSSNIIWSESKVTYERRCKKLGQKGLVVWLTGLSGSGKSTIANELEKRLIDNEKFVYRLDGDNVRHGLNSDLGFSKEERNENIRRIAEVAALFKDAAAITLVSFISPFKQMRELAREKAGKENFIEVYVKASIKACEKRDPKGLYEKVKSGEIKDFTGISSPYEEPESPDLLIDTENMDVNEAVEIIMKKILERI